MRLALWLSLGRNYGDSGKTHELIDGFGVVTVSIGIATARPGDPNNEFSEVEGLFKAADAALYRAKSAGRNQVKEHGDALFFGST